MPSAPSNVTATSPVFSVIELVWTAPEMPNGVIRGYQITYYLTDLGPSNSTVLSTNSSELEFTISDGLLPFANYSVSVSAVTIAAGDRSQVVTVQTNESSELNQCSSQLPKHTQQLAVIKVPFLRLVNCIRSLELKYI